MLCAGVLPVTGCNDWSLTGQADRATTQNQRPSTASTLFGDRSDNPADDVVIVQLTFDVLRIDLPIDTTHHSTKIWNHVDELRGDTAQTALLRRNGFRVGAATAQNWDPIRAIFDACDAKVTRYTQAVTPGQPLTIEVGAVHGAETIFLVTRDDRLEGSTIEAGRKLLQLDYALPPAEGGASVLRIYPEIGSANRPGGWQRTAIDAPGPGSSHAKAFRDLAQTLRLKPGEFLVVGLDAESATSLSVGHRFLTYNDNGGERETVLCISPQPFQKLPRGTDESG